MRKILLNAILLIIVSCAETDPTPVYDFTKFNGKNINEVNDIIGEPDYVVHPSDNTEEPLVDAIQYKHYMKDNVELLITFDQNTLEILSYDLVSSKTYSKKGVLKLANLDLNNMHGFRVDDSDRITFTPSLYEGIRLVPTN